MEHKSQSNLTSDRVDQHLAAVHPSFPDVDLAAPCLDEVPIHLEVHVRETAIRLALASAEMVHRRQSYLAQMVAAVQTEGPSCPAYQSVPIVVHCSTVSRKVHLVQLLDRSHCQMDPSCFAAAESLTRVDPASMSLMVRAMLCIVVCWSLAVDPESCFPACCLPVSLDSRAERRLSRSCCLSCSARRQSWDSVCRRLDCLSSCFQPRPCSMAGQTRHDVKHLK